MSNEGVSPYTWAYFQHYQGKEINILKYTALIKKYENDKLMTALRDICKVTKRIAVSSALLSVRERKKFSDSKIFLGRNAYYLFPCESIPLSIYLKIQPREEVYLYARTEDMGEELENENSVES